jgi:hypothetical protein
MSFKEFLRRTFGGRLHDQRLHLYRKYLSQNFQIEQWFTARDKTIESRDITAAKNTEDFIAKLKKEGIKDPDWYFPVLHEIKRWRVQNQIQQRKEAAKSRWAKEKSKKSLGGGGQFEK